MENMISCNMKSLNQRATKIFMKLINGVSYAKYRKINNNGEGSPFMAVVVEQIGQNKYGKIFSVGHYYQQMGDRMSDPEMTFLLNESDQKVYPLSFEQHGTFAIYEVGARFDENDSLTGLPKRRGRKVCAEHASFANQWMLNIKYQQEL